MEQDLVRRRTTSKGVTTDHETRRRRLVNGSARRILQQLKSLQRILESESTDTAGALGQVLCTLARMSRECGLTTYCSIALHVLEQLSSARQTSYLSLSTKNLLVKWTALSHAYLRTPTDALVAMALIEHMGNLQWERPVCRTQRDALLQGLVADAICLASGC